MEKMIYASEWEEMKATHGEEFTAAIRKLYDFYDGPSIVKWLGSLYDPEIGGFYYSNSARDYEGFLPDVESSQQVFGILGNLGAVPNRDTMIPDDIKKKIVTFARELQSPKDGHFYHPQWPQDKSLLAVDRYGRDYGNATSIINRFTYDTDGDGIPNKLYPKYCVANGTKCALHDGTDQKCVFPIGAESVAEGIAEAKEKVEETQQKSASYPDYSSPEAFTAWLEAFNSGIGKNSGAAHQLAALAPEIASYGYADIFVKHIKDNQKKLFDEQVAAGEKPTGIWQRDYNYRAVWGVYKYMYIFNSKHYNAAIDLKYAPYMIESCLEVIKLPPNKDYAYNDLMNQWSAITNVIANVRTHYGEAEAEKLYGIVRRDPVALVENSIAKLKPFKTADGSFCVRVNGTSPANIYGVHIAVGDLPEGTVNSTHIIVCMYASICAALGCKMIKLCTTDDGEAFVRALQSAKSPEKIAFVPSENK